MGIKAMSKAGSSMYQAVSRYARTISSLGSYVRAVWIAPYIAVTSVAFSDSMRASAAGSFWVQIDAATAPPQEPPMLGCQRTTNPEVQDLRGDQGEYGGSNS